MKRKQKDHFFPAKKRIIAIGAAALIAATTVVPSYSGVFGTLTAEAESSTSTGGAPTLTPDPNTREDAENLTEGPVAYISGIEDTIISDGNPTISLTAYRIAKPTYSKDSQTKDATTFKGFEVDPGYLSYIKQDTLDEYKKVINKKTPDAELVKKLATEVNANNYDVDMSTGDSLISNHFSIEFEPKKDAVDPAGKGFQVWQSTNHGDLYYDSLSKLLSSGKTWDDIDDAEIEKSISTQTNTRGIPAGEYIVLAQSASNAKYIYQPIFLACYYDENGKLAITYNPDTKFTDTSNAKQSSVGAGTNYIYTDDNDAEQTAYMKRDEISIEKSITNSNDATDENGKAAGASSKKGDIDKADDLSIGETGTFQVISQIPNYYEAYKGVQNSDDPEGSSTTEDGIIYTITDNQDDGFDAPDYGDNNKDFIVEVSKDKKSWESVPAANYDLVKGTANASEDGNSATFTEDDSNSENKGNDFQVKFKGDDWLITNATNYVRITYKAKLNQNAKQELAANADTVWLRYTNSIAGATSWKNDNVKEYTFPLQVKKVDSDDSNKALSGAEFTLTRTDGNQTVNGEKNITGTSNANGLIKFEGLDEGTYTLKEIKAPQGYSLNDTEYKISIVPTYEDEGHTLKSYKITMTNSDNSEEKAQTIEIGAEGHTTATDSDVVTVTDTKLNGLPSTGGRGTIVLTLIATIGAAGFLTLHLVNKKKEQDA